jgi:hypothetical protein
MPSSVFDDARARVSRALIAAQFPGGRWEGRDWWVLSPLRADSKIGSFHIAEDGTWYDFATTSGGDFIDLIAKAKNLELKEAAKFIIEASGGVVKEAARESAREDEQHAPGAARVVSKTEKHPPIYPVPTSAIDKLQDTTTSKWTVENHGNRAAGWKYTDSEGNLVFVVVRYDRPDGTKDVVPYYWDGNIWREGQALKEGRPLFNLSQLAKWTGPILVVEGEKCASMKVQGWLLISWSSGAGAVYKTDWKPLVAASAKGQRIVIWPDADHQLDKNGAVLPWEDQPGMKAALAIKNHVSAAEILDVQKYAKELPGWDIVDAKNGGIVPEEFIETCPRYEAGGEEPKAAVDVGPCPFRCLGYDEERYYFILGEQRQQFTIAKGGFTASQLNELAGAAWWAINGAVGRSGGIDVQLAQALVIEMQNKAGLFYPELLRGSGVWREEGEDGIKIVINDGRRIITQDGTTYPLEEYQGCSAYLRSYVGFQNMDGAASTAEDGKLLEQLFITQGFTRRVDALAALGWAIIAPFGGLLSWRPHLWISGRKGTGKTFVQENLISILCGKYAHLGSGKDTEAGIRRTLNMDARPVILDEMEPKSRAARENVSKILDLARNSAGDGSGRVTMASGEGTATFLIRSCFCFASINMPDEGAAISSRIISCELQMPKDEQEKIRKSRELYPRVMREPARYLRRIFRCLPRILEDIDYLGQGLSAFMDGQREADLWAPVLSAAWAIQSDKSISSNEGMDWLNSAMTEQITDHAHTQEDEDRVIEHILAATLMSDEKKSRTVAELLQVSAQDIFGAEIDSEWATKLLSRIGIKLLRASDPSSDGKQTIAIATRSDMIIELLSDTPYAVGYDAQIKRNQLCRNYRGPGVQINYLIGRRASRLLEWNGFKDKYF